MSEDTTVNTVESYEIGSYSSANGLLPPQRRSPTTSTPGTGTDSLTRAEEPSGDVEATVAGIQEATVEDSAISSTRAREPSDSGVLEVMARKIQEVTGRATDMVSNVKKGAAGATFGDDVKKGSTSALGFDDVVRQAKIVHEASMTFRRLVPLEGKILQAGIPLHPSPSPSLSLVSKAAGLTHHRACLLNRRVVSPVHLSTPR